MFILYRSGLQGILCSLTNNVLQGVQCSYREVSCRSTLSIELSNPVQCPERRPPDGLKRGGEGGREGDASE
jgi:hypothetical protein